ncbi:MAG TPA: hypothetical protein PLL50_09825 [Propionicimonas sp.]|nr:hypothetical protein [Propionicimonas sp.]HQA78638.1 hypothetical protein [Propionicimonas sp.]HQD96921.1 hypothetical protein [Propionicimonas sp.]
MNTAIEIYAKTTARLQQVLRSERGQGTIEYVGILFIVAAIVAAILTFVKGADGSTLGQQLLDAIGKAITDVTGG